MENPKNTPEGSNEAGPVRDTERNTIANVQAAEAFAVLERAVYAALETYSNVHRGSGHASMVTTRLYEYAREIVLEYLGLNKNKYVVIFLTSRRAEAFKDQLPGPESFRMTSSGELGLALNVTAIAIKRNALPAGAPLQTGGGTTRLISREWVIWANAPDKFEAGTPAVINVIAFAKALLLVKKYGKTIFRELTAEKLTASEILYHDELETFHGSELTGRLRQTLIGRGLLVPTLAGRQVFINLDNSASTPTFEPVWNAFRQTLRMPEEVALEIIEQVKAIVAGMMGAPLPDYEVIFTSNTTEAINLAAESLGRESGPVVVNTLLEHNSNDLPWRMLKGCLLIRLSVDAEGFIDLKELDSILSEYNQTGRQDKKRISLVAMSGASNVLGSCNDITAISRIVHKHGAKLLVDAAQLAAHRSIRMEESGIDYLAFSAHKVYAPFGCGVLLARKELLNFDPEELKKIQSYSSENAGGIAALGKSLLLLQRIGMDMIRQEEQALTERLLRGLEQIEGLKVYGVKSPDSPGFSSKLGVIVFSMKKMMPNQLAKELALRCGIGVRYGCHCAHIIVKRILHLSPFLEGFQRMLVVLFPKLKLPGVLRVSLGIENTREDIDTLLRELQSISGKPGVSADSDTAAAPGQKPVVSRQEAEQQIKEFIKNAELRVYSLP